MKISKIILLFLAIISFLPISLAARDILLEFKGAYFHATGSRFKNIYGKSAALYGPEITFQLGECSAWYGFASVDFLHKKGHSIGLDTPTSIRFMPIAIGLKYFLSTCFECADFYAGLGFQPVHVRIKNDSEFVDPCISKWALGGIAKIGAYFYLSDCIFLNLFAAYSCARVSPCVPQIPEARVVSFTASISGAILGIGLGYRF